MKRAAERYLRVQSRLLLLRILLQRVHRLLPLLRKLLPLLLPTHNNSHHPHYGHQYHLQLLQHQLRLRFTNRIWYHRKFLRMKSQVEVLGADEAEEVDDDEVNGIDGKGRGTIIRMANPDTEDTELTDGGCTPAQDIISISNGSMEVSPLVEGRV